MNETDHRLLQDKIAQLESRIELLEQKVQKEVEAKISLTTTEHYALTVGSLSDPSMIQKWRIDD